MRKLGLSVLVVCCYTLGLVAQSVMLPHLNRPANNSVHLVQVGEQNDAEVKQMGYSWSQNSLNIRQQGNLNKAQVLVHGGAITTDVMQLGNSNRYTAQMINVYNNSNIIAQNGSGNVVEQQIRNSSGIQTEFRQNGDNNFIRQELNNIHNQTYKLTQNGSNLRAFIIQSGQ